MADLVTKPRPAGFHQVTPVASSAMATPVAPIPFWRAPGWMSSERPVPCAKAADAMASPRAQPRTMRVNKRIVWLLMGERDRLEHGTRPGILHRKLDPGSSVRRPGAARPTGSTIEDDEAPHGRGLLPGTARAVGIADVDVHLIEVGSLGERIPLVVQAVP